MGEFFRSIFSIDEPFNMIVAVVLIVFTAWLLGSIVEQIRKYGCHRKDVELKRELVDRGLSAEEIERIIKAQPEKRNESPNVVGNQYITQKD